MEQIFTSKFSYSKRLLILFGMALGMLISITSIDAQMVNYVTDGPCGSFTFTYESSDGGSPARNIYTASGNNGPVDLYWNTVANRWEIRAFDFFDGSSIVRAYSDYASFPNPPNLSVGNWVIPAAVCGNITQLDGSGVQGFLPVELTTFKAKKDANSVLLAWQTATEINNEKFVIEESIDGQQFQAIGDVKGTGTTFEQQDYSFEVHNPKTGTSYFRLKQIDFDGQHEYSDVISVLFGKEGGQIGGFYPNPSKSGLVHLNYDVQDDRETTVNVFDVTGKLVSTQIRPVNIGKNNLTFDFSDLNSGLYIIQIGNTSHSVQRKLIIER